MIIILNYLTSNSNELSYFKFSQFMRINLRYKSVPNRHLSIHIKPTIQTLKTFYVHLVVRLFHEVRVCTHIHYVQKSCLLGCCSTTQLELRRKQISLLIIRVYILFFGIKNQSTTSLVHKDKGKRKYSADKSTPISLNFCKEVAGNLSTYLDFEHY